MSMMRIAKEIREKNGLKPREFWDTDQRGPKVVGARWEFLQRLAEEKQWTINRISTETGFDRNSIRNALERSRDGFRPHEGSGRGGHNRKPHAQDASATNPH